MGTGVVRGDLRLSYGGAPWWYINRTRIGEPKKNAAKSAWVDARSGNRCAWYGTCLFCAMKFHKDRDNRLHPLRPAGFEAPPPRNAKFVLRRPGTLGPRPTKRQSLRSEWPSQNDGIADDSPMIAACYEGHLSMEKMLAAFAELRGDDAGDAIG
jgi:hypothetical protein